MQEHLSYLETASRLLGFYRQPLASRRSQGAITTPYSVSMYSVYQEIIWAIERYLKKKM